MKHILITYKYKYTFITLYVHTNIFLEELYIYSINKYSIHFTNKYLHILIFLYRRQRGDIMRLMYEGADNLFIYFPVI
jgi:hypothetical protein